MHNLRSAIVGEWYKFKVMKMPWIVAILLFLSALLAKPQHSWYDDVEVINPVDNVHMQCLAFFPALLFVSGLFMCREYSHHTGWLSTLSYPRRWQLVVAKLAVMVPYTLLLMLADMVLVGVVLSFYDRSAFSVMLDAKTLPFFIQFLFGAIVTTVLGIGVGAIVKSQTITYLVFLGWMTIVPLVELEKFEESAKYFPSVSYIDILLASIFDEPTFPQDIIVLGIFGVLIVALGVMVHSRRDLP